MKNYFSEFKSENKPERLIQILTSWRLWILGGIVGALIGAGLYTVFPPKYRAHANVVVDHNIEQAFVFFEDRDLFTFMHRETEKLKAIAWSDEVWGNGTGYIKGTSSEDINLVLAQDGIWSFYIDGDDRNSAYNTAKTWASNFIEASYAAVEVSAELEVARDALEDFLADNPNAELRDINPYLDEIRTLQEEVQGISQYIDLTLSKDGMSVVERSVGMGTYILAGTILIILAATLTLLFLPAKNKDENA